MGFLSGKRILVTGVASKLSIAYGIAQAMHREGAELAFTYQNDKLKGRDDIQIADNRPTFMPYEPNGTYATNRHTRRMLRKLHGIQAKRMCDLKGGQK